MNNRNIKILLSTERRMVNSHRCAAWLILIGSVQSLCPSPLDQGRYLVVVAFFCIQTFGAVPFEVTAHGTIIKDVSKRCYSFNLFQFQYRLNVYKKYDQCHPQASVLHLQ